jgi:ribonuclease P protein component
VVRGLGRVSGVERFAALGRTRHRTRSGPLRVAWVPGDDDCSSASVAFAIGRRVGSSVVRNRLRRRLRAILVELRPAPGDYLVVADPAAASVSFSDLKALVSTALASLSPTSSAS